MPMRPSAADRRRPVWGDGLVALLVVLAAAALLFALRPESGNFLTASVVLKGETIATYDLSALTGPVELGRICIAESSCPGRDCVHTGWVSRAGGQIICLPNRLVISLTGSGSDEIDAVTG